VDVSVRVEIMTDEILIVEDDPDLRPLLEYTFENEEFEVTAYPDGSGALEYLTDGGQPSCIVLDLMMPGVDGLDVLEERAEDEELAAIPVIMLTGRDADESVEKAFDRGADDYVTKPFSPNELVMRVRRLLE
jgi:DNA-binding response OmpR family regulator